MNPFLSELIDQILKYLAPWLPQSVIDWIKGLFTKSAPTSAFAASLAAHTPADASGIDRVEAARDLIATARKSIKGLKPFKRATLRVMEDVIPAAIARGDKKLKAADGGSELKAVGSKADGE